MALADYAAPIADEDNPLLSWVRVSDGVIETAQRRAQSAARARADPLALSERAVRVPGAAGGGAHRGRARTRRRPSDRPDAAGARRRRDLEHPGDAPHPRACPKSKTSTSSRTWATAGWRLAPPQPRRPRRASRSGSTLRASISALAIRRLRSRTRCARPASTAIRSAIFAARVADLARRRPHRHVVPGADGVRPARARPPQRPRAARPARVARSAEPGAQAARVVPAVLPEHARERGRAPARRLERRTATAA